MVVADLDGDRQDSQVEAQAFWQGYGAYYIEFVEQLPWNLVRALLAAALIFVGLLLAEGLRPRVARQFKLARPRRSIRLFTSFGRADAWLRIRRPVLWSTKIHTFNAYVLFWIGVVIMGCVLLHVESADESSGSLLSNAWTGITDFWLPIWLLAAFSWWASQSRFLCMRPPLAGISWSSLDIF